MKKNEPKIKKRNIIKEYNEMKPTLIRKNNLRYIEPYEFKYQVFAKGRWVGKKLLDVLIHEFRQYDLDYFVKTIREGKLLIHNKQVDPSHIIKRDDFITHIITRKENPIIDQKVEILYENEDILVVDKPSSWPVHACGAYNFNTLHKILMDEHGYQNLLVLHRLDKPTSGILLMGKNKKTADNFQKKLHSDMVQKTYLCRVKGNFPDEKINVIRSIVVLDKAKGIYTDVDGNHKRLNINNTAIDNDRSSRKSKYDKSGVKIDKEEEEEDEFDEEFDAKYAETNFEKLFYDENSNTSVVVAKPVTGRTHQIRIHLRYVGYPIANDPCYGGIVFNDLGGFDNPDLFKENNTNNDNETENSASKVNENYGDTTTTPQVFCYKIWLHSWNYKFDKYEFETKYPQWASKDYLINKIFT